MTSCKSLFVAALFAILARLEVVLVASAAAVGKHLALARLVVVVPAQDGRSARALVAGQGALVAGCGSFCTIFLNLMLQKGRNIFSRNDIPLKIII